MSPAVMAAGEVLAWLERRGTKRNVAGMARYGIVARKAFGVPMATMLALRRKVGMNQPLSLALWKTGWHEAKLFAAMVGDPARVTSRQMDTWARSFENWADCDTACFKLFDRSPLAWEKARQWAVSPREFVRRGGFALMASLALHDKQAPDARFRAFFPLIERGAGDERDIVRKGVSWALRGIGHRSRGMRTAAMTLAKRLARSPEAGRRWVGKDVLRDLSRAD